MTAKAPEQANQPAAVARLPLYELVLRDPLGESARSERRNLLATSVVGLLVARLDLVPKGIQAFGITFNAAHQRALVMAFVWIVFYFFVAFVIYAFADFFNRLADKVSAAEEDSMVATTEMATMELERATHIGVANAERAIMAKYSGRSGARQHARAQVPLYGLLEVPARLAAYLRALIEYVLPCVLAGVAIRWLEAFAGRLKG